MNNKVFEKMKWLVLFWLAVSFHFSAKSAEGITTWARVVTSQNYDNTRLVLESDNPFPLQYIRKAGSFLSTAVLVCSQFCANNGTCRGFNVYPIATHYVCEMLHENFCFQRQRIALQAWSGGTVWDKLDPGMKSSCIDSKLTSDAVKNCELGRSGCRPTWPDCNTCVRSGRDCATLYNKHTNDKYNCTMWPEGPSQTPIFGFCQGPATFLIKREVDLSKGLVLNYLMSFTDMYRLSKLRTYQYLRFTFQPNSGGAYSSKYANFFIDSNGTLMNMTYQSGNGQDGFNSTVRRPSSFTWVTTNSDCGSFWFVNSTQNASLACPGGGIRMFGKIDIKASPQKTGIRWPTSPVISKVIISTGLRLDVN